MQTGDLVMFRGTGFIATVIRLWTRSYWGHCGVLWICDGVPMVIESQWPDGVSVHALANRKDDGPDIYHTGRLVRIPDALKHCGEPYSFKDAMLAAVGKTGGHLGWECAELAAHLYDVDHEPKGWTPQNLMEYLAVK